MVTRFDSNRKIRKDFIIDKGSYIEENLNEHLLESVELQELQDKFSNASNLYTICFGKSVGVLTIFSGLRQERTLIEKMIGKNYYFNMLKHLQDITTEDALIQDTQYSFIKIAGMNVIIDGNIVASWVITAVLSDKIEDTADNKILQYFSKVTTSTDFYKSIDLLRVMSKRIFIGRYNEVSANEEALRSRDSEIRMAQELKKNEAMTAIVQMLESDKTFEEIINTVLRTVGEYLDISSVNLIRVNKKKKTIDMIGEWANYNVNRVIRSIKNFPMEAFPMLDEKPCIISSDTVVPEKYESVFDKYNVKAVVSLPIELNERIIMYVSFIETRHIKIWNESTVKFLFDVKQIIQSIITKRVTKNSLVSSYASLEAILENVGCGIYVRDLNSNKTLFANQKIKTEFRREIEDDNFEKILQNVRRDNNNKDNLELYYSEKNKWYDVNFMDIVWVDGRKVSLCTVYDVTDRKIYQKKIEQQANNDFLTGLYNRMRCEADLADVIREVKNENGSGALLYLDLDDFKHINDGLGHQYGDILLKEVSSLIRRIEGIENNCYRMGGDEFIIIVSNKHFSRLDTIISKIKEIFSKSWYLKGADYYCTMSMGVVVFPQDGNTVQEIIKMADIAMYEAKKKGKNCVEYYNQRSESASYKRLDLEKNMRNATADEFREFEVYYQPIIDVHKPGNPCTGAEALIRWNSKQLGFISPAEFIPLAEYLGLINPIGDFVLERACMDCKFWNDNGHPDYKVNVNLSVVQLLQNNIVEKVAYVLNKTGINPRNLTLEVTESLAINDMERMKTILGGIKALGVRIALDDFGTGYSSLNHIKEIPLDVIKVDQCFVNDLNNDDYAWAFVKMVTELANAIGVTVCVEGVEEKEQYEILTKMKVTLIQGYYFGKPMRGSDFEEKYVGISR